MTGYEDDFDNIDDAPSVEELWAAMVEISARLDDLATQVLTPRMQSGASASLVYESVDAWVEGWFSVHVSRDTTGNHLRWCAQWTDHPEAHSRLTGLWQRWEELTPEWGGISTWWREADAQVGQLMSPDGTFRQCRIGDPPRHRAAEPLPSDPPSVNDPSS